MSIFFTVIIVCLAVTVLLYFWLIMPRIVARPDMSAFKNQYFAHRGLYDREKSVPENSLKAFRRAVNRGYGIELDVQLSKDGIPVVFHDFTLDRVCGVKGRVAEFTCEELQQFSLWGTEERIPKFEDVLKLVNGKVPLIVELKIESTNVAVCPLADRLLSEYRGAYCIESFNPFGLAWYRCNRGRVPRGQLSDAFLKEEYRNVRGLDRFLYFILQNLLTNFLSRPDFIAYHHPYAGKFSFKLCRKLFRAVTAAWTIRSEEELSSSRKDFDIYIFECFIPEK